MKKVDVILGLQWGDEGKGKVVDVLTPHYQVVARFQGGPNAGHTLEFNGEKYVLRSIPSGIFQGDKVNVIGNGVVLDPILFKEEAEALARSGHDLTERLYISKKAHLILPTHRVLDAAFEAAKGSSKIGTTGKGIGPTYTDKISRNGVRVGDIFLDFKKIYEVAKARHENILESLGYNYDIDELERQWFEGIEYLKKFRIIDSEHEINRFLAEDKATSGRRRTGYAARRRFRFVPVRDLFEYDLCGRLHGPRYRPQPYRRGLRHLQGLLYARGQRAFPNGVVRRDGRGTVPARS